MSVESSKPAMDDGRLKHEVLQQHYSLDIEHIQIHCPAGLISATLLTLISNTSVSAANQPLIVTFKTTYLIRQLALDEREQLAPTRNTHPSIHLSNGG